MNYSGELTYCQSQMLTDTSRFRLLRSGRRIGKTVLLAVEALKELTASKSYVIYFAPTYQQANRIFSPAFEGVVNYHYEHVNNVADVVKSPYMAYKFRNGSILEIHGATNVDNLRGQGYTHVIFDEAAFYSYGKELYSRVIRPAIAQTQGRITIATTPDGRNNYIYDLEQSGEFSVHHYTTLQGGLVPPEEIAHAEKTLDAVTFAQEFLATYESSGNLVYYSYSEMNYSDVVFSPNRRTIMAWDFNVDPMSCILCQEIAENVWVAVKEFSPRNANTEMTCELVDTFLKDNKFSSVLLATGDYSGNQRRSSASHTDWTIIKKRFGAYIGFFARIFPTKHIKDRVLALNSMFKTASGLIKMYVNRNECPLLHKDLITQEWVNNIELSDNNGTIGHKSDALSYLANNFYPIQLFERNGVL